MSSAPYTHRLSLRLLLLLLLWLVFALSKSISYTGFPQMGDNPWGAVTFKRKTQNNVANSVYMERKSAGGFQAVWSPDHCIFLLLYSKWEEPSDLVAGGVLEASRVGLGNFYQISNLNSTQCLGSLSLSIRSHMAETRSSGRWLPSCQVQGYHGV